jgi:hypothetical protein
VAADNDDWGGSSSEDESSEEEEEEADDFEPEIGPTLDEQYVKKLVSVIDEATNRQTKKPGQGADNANTIVGRFSSMEEVERMLERYVRELQTCAPALKQCECQ